eukprot:Em0007g1577a
MRCQEEGEDDPPLVPRLGKPEGFQWSASLQGYPFQQTPLALTPTSPHPPPTAFTTYIPMASGSGLTAEQQMHLEQHMEVLNVNERGDHGSMEGSGVYQGGQHPGGEAQAAAELVGGSIHFLSPGGHILTYQDGQMIHSGQITLGPLALQSHGHHHFSLHTQSPVQILGHTLGTSLFSPPPSSSSPHGIIVNFQTSAGKVFGEGPPGSPARTPVGSGVRLCRYDSPKHGHAHIGGEVPVSVAPSHPPAMSPVDSPPLQQKPVSKLSTSGLSPVSGGSPSGFPSPQLPPRLVQQQQQQQLKNTGTRYQNQRHPVNRGVVSAAKPATVETSPTQFATGGVGSKKEPLLPMPPSSLKMKLGTNLTCGVPLNVMEILKCPAEGSPELKQAMQRLTDLGVLELKSTLRSGKRGDSITIAIFDSPESAAKALHQ